MKEIIDVFNDCYKEILEHRQKNRQSLGSEGIIYNSIKAIESGQEPEVVLKYVLMYLFGQNENLTAMLLKAEERRTDLTWKVNP